MALNIGDEVEALTANREIQAGEKGVVEDFTPFFTMALVRCGTKAAWFRTDQIRKIDK